MTADDNAHTEAEVEAAFGSEWFRQVLGQYPTGVTVVTALDADGAPAGLAIGSFTSVSLDPPLVAFLPGRTSASWGRIRPTGRFCVNVLAAGQEDIGRRFAVSGADKYAGLNWRPAPSGLPILEGVVAWLDCRTEDVHEAGDHDIVIGHVTALDVETPGLPMLFFRGGYGRFTPLSLAAHDADLLGRLHLVDRIRHEVESLAADLRTECIVVAPQDEQLVFLASAGERRDPTTPTRVGQRVPFAAPFGSPLVAFESDARVDAWLLAGGIGTDTEAAAQVRTLLAQVRRTGYTLGVGYGRFAQLERTLSDTQYTTPSAERPADIVPTADRQIATLLKELHDSYAVTDVSSEQMYEARNLSAPVLGPDGRAVVQLTIYGPTESINGAELARWSGRLTEAARRSSAALAGG